VKGNIAARVFAELHHLTWERKKGRGREREEDNSNFLKKRGEKRQGRGAWLGLKQKES